jgi:ATP phosphoribosyltransferase regulatory subunit HisZ
MILEHEIPNGSRLYFGKLAKQKRYLEAKVSEFFSKLDFEEIITPNFSYSQHQSIDNINKLITIKDETNNQVALRADSTLDVARIVIKRLGRTTNHKKWFYIQPVFSYPSVEQYQIGVEWLEHENVSDIINLTAKTFELLDLKPIIQIANINIPKLISKHLDIDLQLFANGEIGKLLHLDIKWLSDLIYVQSIDDLRNIIDELPQDIKQQAQKLINISLDIDYENIIISPLYYSAMKYYTDVYFRVMKDNLTVAFGGQYESNGLNSLGFALYTDNLLRILD